MTQGAKIDIVTYVDTSGYKLTTYPVSIIDPSTCILARLSVWEIIVLFISCFLKVVKSDFFSKCLLIIIIINIPKEYCTIGGDVLPAQLWNEAWNNIFNEDDNSRCQQSEQSNVFQIIYFICLQTKPSTATSTTKCWQKNVGNAFSQLAKLQS